MAGQREFGVRDVTAHPCGPERGDHPLQQLGALLAASGQEERLGARLASDGVEQVRHRAEDAVGLVEQREGSHQVAATSMWASPRLWTAFAACTSRPTLWNCSDALVRSAIASSTCPVSR